MTNTKTNPTVEVIQQGAVVGGKEVRDVEIHRLEEGNVAMLQLSDGTTVQMNRAALQMALAELDDADGFDAEMEQQG